MLLKALAIGLGVHLDTPDQSYSKLHVSSPPADTLSNRNRAHKQVEFPAEQCLP